VAADEMHFVVAQRQRVRQLRGDDAAAAHRRIAHDRDIHGVFSSESRASSSRTTMPSANSTPICAPNCASRLSIRRRNAGAESRVATASSPVGANWLVKQSSARRLTSYSADTSTTNDGVALLLMK